MSSATLVAVNFLAHSYFGFNDSALITGQFCGDFVRGSNLSQFPAQVERGIRLHRHLDSFTDAHPALLSARGDKVTEVSRRLSGIVIDVLFDHYLARHWNEISKLSLEQHAHTVQLALQEHEQYLPPRLRRFMVLLHNESILQNSIYLESIELTLARIASRSSTFAALALTTAQLAPISDRLSEPFKMFFPDLQVAASRFLQPPTGVINE